MIGHEHWLHWVQIKSNMIAHAPFVIDVNIFSNLQQLTILEESTNWINVRNMKFLSKFNFDKLEKLTLDLWTLGSSEQVERNIAKIHVPHIVTVCFVGKKNLFSVVLPSLSRNFFYNTGMPNAWHKKIILPDFAYDDFNKGPSEDAKLSIFGLQFWAAKESSNSSLKSKKK
jgi:hypothetical protein